MSLGRLVRQDHVLLHMHNGDQVEVNEYLDTDDIWQPLTFEKARNFKNGYFLGRFTQPSMLRTTYMTSRGRERIVTEIVWGHVQSITAREFDEHPDGPRA